MVISNRAFLREHAWHSSHTPNGAKDAALKAAESAIGSTPRQIQEKAMAASLSEGSTLESARLHGLAATLHIIERNGMELLMARIHAAFLVQKLFHKKRFRRKTNSSKKVQALFRGHQARVTLKGNHASANKLQKTWRRQQGRIKARAQQYQKVLEESERHEAASRLASTWRGTKARDKVKEMKETELQNEYKKALEESERHEAASCLASTWRGTKSRDKVNEMKETELQNEYKKALEESERHEAASCLASTWRGAKSRDRVKEMKENELQNEYQKALEESERHEAASCLAPLYVQCQSHQTGVTV
eukprot:g4054.t1